MPHLTLMSDAYEDTFSTAVFAVAVPAHLGAVPVHDRASRVFQCASSTSTVETSAASSSSSATPHTDTPLQRLSRMIRMRQQLELADDGSDLTAPEVLDAIWHVGAPDTTMVADPTKRQSDLERDAVHRLLATGFLQIGISPGPTCWTVRVFDCRGRWCSVASGCGTCC